MILHITNDYSGSTVYKNLVGELDKLNLEQIVYNPIREASRIGKNKIDLKNKKSKIFYSKILNKYTDRILYKKKINKIVKDIELKVDLTKITCIHAHTWYSDGGVAYELFKKYNIPFIIAIRTTDVNVFYKYLIPYRSYAKEILNSSRNIILINNVFKTFIHQLDSSLVNKIRLVPNGVDRFWIENFFIKEKLEIVEKKVFNLIYVGTFIKRKNLLNLIQAVIEINKIEDIRITLNIVGHGKGSYFDKIEKIIVNNNNNIKLLGKITDKAELLKTYRENDFFAMPSVKETFGLVYVEAMLQGLPILYTANEGIDGLYDENIGEKVLSTDVREIQKNLLKMIQNYKEYKIPTEKLVVNHNWENIAKQYKELYNA